MFKFSSYACVGTMGHFREIVKFQNFEKSSSAPVGQFQPNMAEIVLKLWKIKYFRK